MAQTFAVLSDGTTAASFADGAGGATWYKIESSWTPRIANLRRSQLGGRGPYEDVREDLPISIGGSNAAHMYANLSTLKQLLDQADRWRRNENVSAVTFRYSPTHATISSAASPLKAAVWDTDLQLPDTFDVINAGSATTVWMQGARLGFTRNGELTHSDQSGSASAITNGDIATISLGASTKAFSPTAITFTNAMARSDVPTGFLAISDQNNGISILDAETLATAGLYTSVADSANYARNGSVLRYTPADTTKQRTLAASFSNTGKRLAVLLNARAATGSTASYAINARFGNSSTLIYDETPAYTLSGLSATPNWYNIGTISLQYVPTYADLAITASASGGTLDIDSVVFVDVGQLGGYVAAIDFNGYTTLLNTTLTIDQRRISSPGYLISDNTSAFIAWGWRGDVSFYTRAASVYGLWMKTGGSTSATRWRTESASAAQTNTWTLTRPSSYLTPE